jgi:hypothetical protein
MPAAAWQRHSCKQAAEMGNRRRCTFRRRFLAAFFSLRSRFRLCRWDTRKRRTLTSSGACHRASSARHAALHNSGCGLLTRTLRPHICITRVFYVRFLLRVLNSTRI